jgi:para-nitrobenzyl esterase
VFACNSRQASGLLSQHVPTYQYEFADDDAPMLFFPPVSFGTGAYHAAELQYLFGLPGTPVPSPGLDPAQQQRSHAMVRYWTQFARTGDPNSSTTPTWPPYDVSGQQFRTLAPPAPAAASGFAIEHQCSNWTR